MVISGKIEAVFATWLTIERGWSLQACLGRLGEVIGNKVDAAQRELEEATLEQQ